MKKCKFIFDELFWFLVLLLPMFCYFIMYYRIGGVSFLTFIDDWSFGFVKTALNQVWNMVFSSDCVLSSLLSYFASVEICHVFYDLVVFIPRFAHDIGEKVFIKG